MAIVDLQPKFKYLYSFCKSNPRSFSRYHKISMDFRCGCIWIILRRQKGIPSHWFLIWICKHNLSSQNFLMICPLPSLQLIACYCDDANRLREIITKKVPRTFILNFLKISANFFASLLFQNMKYKKFASFFVFSSYEFYPQGLLSVEHQNNLKLSNKEMSKFPLQWTELWS